MTSLKIKYVPICVLVSSVIDVADRLPSYMKNVKTSLDRLQSKVIQGSPPEVGFTSTRRLLLYLLIDYSGSPSSPSRQVCLYRAY